MSSDRRSPWWPYLLVLAGLFVLSLAVPSGWQTVKVEHKRNIPSEKTLVKPQLARVRPTVVHPKPEPALTVAERVNSSRVEQQPIPSTVSAILTKNQPDISVDNITAQPLTEMVAKKIADARRFFAHRLTNTSLSERARTATLALPPNSTLPSVSTGPINSASLPSESTNAISSDVTWPSPQSLIDQLDDLSQHLECRDWAMFAKQLCETLAATPIDQPKHAMAVVGQLHSSVSQADGVARQIKEPAIAAEFRRAQYALQRRLLAWDLAVTDTNRTTAYANVLSGEEQIRKLKESVSAVQAYLHSIPHGDAWAKYLALEELGQITSAGSLPSSDQIQTVARQTLNRISPRQTTPAQRQILGDKSIQALAEQLQTLSANPVDSRELLAEIERYEASRLPSDAVNLVAVQQRLAWSADQTDKELAQHLENHYRNANVRMALAAELLSRLTPGPITSYGRVSEVIVGTPVQGQSVNTTEFQVRLIPDPRRIHLWLEAYGEVVSRTQSSSGPATVNNRGVANFIVRKAVMLDDKGLGIARASTEADTRSRLTGVSTNFDGIPLIGSMVRNYAESQYDEMREQARWESREKVATQAGQRVDSEVNQRLQQAEDRVKRELLTPLANMDLELEPITMETFADRTAMRMRLAGAHQLGGHTARPQAPSDSLASVQLHESALNNILDQLKISGRTFELPELYKHLAQRMSRPEPKLPDDLPEGVFITFADQNAVRVRCDNEKVRLTLAIKELRQGSRQWQDFAITTTYKPEIVGRQATLARQGIIELDGEAYKGKTEVALRGIFSKILSRERKFHLVPSLVVDHPRLTDTQITQCTIEDGWIGIALGLDRNISRGVARRPVFGNLKK